MNARLFFKSSIILAAVVVGIVPIRVVASDADQPQYYELRVYNTQSTEQWQRVNDYWQNAAVPAYNRQGIQPVGVFTELQDAATNKIYVLNQSL